MGIKQAIKAEAMMMTKYPLALMGLMTMVLQGVYLTLTLTGVIHLKHVSFGSIMMIVMGAIYFFPYLFVRKYFK